MPRSFFADTDAGGEAGGGREVRRVAGNPRRRQVDAPPGNTQISSRRSDVASAEEFPAQIFIALLMK